MSGLLGFLFPSTKWASLGAQMVKNPPTMRETWVQSLGWENPLETGTATHSSVLAWRIPWTKELGRSGAKGTSLTWEGRVGTERPADIKWLGEHRRFYDCLVLNRRGLTRETQRLLGIWRAWLRSETMNSQSNQSSLPCSSLRFCLDHV